MKFSATCRAACPSLRRNAEFSIAPERGGYFFGRFVGRDHQCAYFVLEVAGVIADIGGQDRPAGSKVF